MSRDMKNHRRSEPRRQGSPLLLGMMIGTLMGVGIAVGLILFLNLTPAPFNSSLPAASAPATAPTHTDKAEERRPEIMQPNGNSALHVVDNASDPASATNASTVQPINYDFYKMLADNEDKPNKGPVSAPDGQKPVTPLASSQTSNPLPKKYLQLGAFESEQQADNFKAKLALLGVEAQIQSKNNGDTIIHRVRMGPFTSEEALNRMRSQLKRNGVDSSVATG